MDKIVTTYKKLKKIVQILENKGTKPTDEITFEFIVGSLFPNVYSNIVEEMRRQHAEGYMEGLQARKEFDN